MYFFYVSSRQVRVVLDTAFLRYLSLSFYFLYNLLYIIFQYFTIFQSSHNLSIFQSFHNLLLFTISSNIYYIYRIVSIYVPFSEVHIPLRVSEISSELILYIISPLYLFSLRLMQLNVCHILHSRNELLKYSPTYRIFPHDSSEFAGCFLLQSITITIYFGLSPNHAIIFKADRLQMIVVAKKYICVATVHQ